MVRQGVPVEGEIGARNGGMSLKENHNASCNPFPTEPIISTKVRVVSYEP